MKSQTQKISLIIIVGPTASGKSALGIFLAKEYNGEIISADSRQVYRHLTIGTGKVMGMWKRRPKQDRGNWFVSDGVPHHLIDFVPPRRHYSAAEFCRDGKTAIADIVGRGKTPLIVGGTGFWIDTLVGRMPIAPIPPNTRLRAHLARKTPKQLFTQLVHLDPMRAKHIDRNNSHRLIRALEIAQAGVTPPPIKSVSPYRTLWIGITLTREEMRERITRRLRHDLRRGMVAEVRRLHASGVSWQRLEQFGLEYRLIARHLRSFMDKKTLLAQLERVLWQYAKRQMTWWRRNDSINWISTPKEAQRLVRIFLATTLKK
ncbi:MAG: tRNA (adenosine(37)-N6)-dimethylallyltransferase MiaA [bacterium]|nr:tRNA (adenosine(37)-N6)-dimethylallyltransferase MiaA [bacterium]MDZ4299620.1 tRNA (adenosine(37)-N6)-dimethylallyltransferase MiaA [Candidatus Sungbacteria bacterium]